LGHCINSLRSLHPTRRKPLQQGRSKRRRKSFHSISCRSRSKNHDKSPHRLQHPIHCRNYRKNPRRSIASTGGKNCRWSCPTSRRRSLLPIHRTNRPKNHFKSSRSFQPDPSQEPWQQDHRFVQPTHRMYRCRSRCKKRRKILLLIRSTNPHESHRWSCLRFLLLIRHTNLC